IGDRGTVAIPLPSGSVTTDLAALDGVSSLLAQAAVPPANYGGVHVSIANTATVVWADGTQSSLTVASGQLDVAFVTTIGVTSSSTLDVKVDVDLARSLKIAAATAGGALLHPVVQASGGPDAASSLDGATEIEPQIGTVVTIDSAAGTL